MLNFYRHTLKNGLKIVVHEDKTTPLACLNILYKVGAKNENPEKTGMAHFFEHLMFTGSKNVADFDAILEEAGGENNAFTNNDITNFYQILPAQNIETAFWLESDRMKNLSFTEKGFKTQKSVVIEEFKEVHINQPYGDIDEIIRALAYDKHPYKWSTIGKNVSHIKNTSKKDLKEFYNKYYTPNNAVLVITGNVNTENIIELSQKYFGNIPASIIDDTIIPTEPKQTEIKIIEHYANVPQDAIVMAFHMGSRLNENFYAADLTSDILANGKSSRLYSELVKGKKYFSELDTWIHGSVDPGLIMIQGYPHSKYNLKDAEKAILNVINELSVNQPTDYECAKVANKAVSSWMFSNLSIENKAYNLAFFEMLGEIGKINTEEESYLKVDKQQIQDNIKSIYKPENCSILRYYAK